MEYKGYGITPDKQQGYSGLEPKGKWMFSVISIEKAKEIIDNVTQI